MGLITKGGVILWIKKNVVPEKIEDREKTEEREKIEGSLIIGKTKSQNAETVMIGDPTRIGENRNKDFDDPQAFFSVIVISIYIHSLAE